MRRLFLILLALIGMISGLVMMIWIGYSEWQDVYRFFWIHGLASYGNYFLPKPLEYLLQIFAAVVSSLLYFVSGTVCILKIIESIERRTIHSIKR